MNKTILISGVAGFIGTNLALHFLMKNYEVIGLDNFFSGTQENIDTLKKFKNFSFIEWDIRKPLGELDLPGINEIYNLACPASPPFYQGDPIFTLETNFLGTKNMLDLALRKGAKILQASTSEVYGDPEISEQPESYRGNVTTLGPRACYDEGKRIAETLCYEYQKLGVSVKIIRIFNTYGPYMRLDDGRVITNFIRSILTGKPLSIYGQGTQTRSFQYITDLIDGIEAVMGSSLTGPVNLGNPGEFTILELIREIENIFNTNFPKDYMPLPGDDPKQRKPDITLAKSLGWFPVVPISTGFLKTYEFFEKQIK